MRETPIKVLLIEDEPRDARLIREMLAEVTTPPIYLSWVDRLVTGLKSLATDGFDVVVLDLVLPDSQGLTTFVRTRARAPQVPIIVLAEVGDEAVAVKAVREGAQDYLVKGRIDGHLLGRAMRYAIDRRRMEAELQGYVHELATKTRYLRALTTLSRTVSGSTDLQQVLNFVVEATGGLLGVKLTQLWIWNEAAEVLDLVASTGDTALEAYHRRVLRLGEGLAGLAFECRETLATDAPASDPRFLNQDWAQENGVCPQVAVPVLIGQSAVGVLTAVRRASKPFDADELTLLGSLADQAAMAIENRRLSQERQKRLEREQTLTHELKRIKSVAAQLTSNLDLSQVLHPLVSAVAEACGTPMSAVLIADQEKRELVPGATVGLPDEQLQAISCFLIGPTAYRNEVVMIEDTRIDPMTIPYLDLLELYGLRAIWSVPLRDNRGRVLGTVTTCFDKPHRPTPEQIEVVNLYARHAAIALENAQLFQEIQLHNRSLVALNRVAQTVNRSLNLQEILEASLDAVLQAVEVEAGIIRLWDEREQALVVAAHRGIRAEYLASMQHLGMGTGVAGKTFQRRDPVIVEDIEQYPHLGDVTEKEGVRSLASIPIRSRARVVGVISILSHTPTRFTSTQIDLLTAIGNQLGTAFENARLFQQIAKAKREWDVTFDTIADGIALLDERGTVVRANNAFGTLWEAPLKDLIGTVWHDVANRLEFVAPCPHCLAWQIKQPASAEARIPTSSRILTLTAFPIQPWEAIPAELISGTILVIRDITAERQRERLAMLGHLAAGVAHEINNPLSVILGFSQLLLRRVDPHSETYHDLKLIEKQSRACRQIVDDLRHLARPLPLKRELINLNQLIQETLEPLEHSLVSRKVQVSLILDPRLPSLSADRRLLGQVLLNLITNAADAMPEGGTVTIVSRVKQKDVVEVAVTDTGVGITPEHLRWIFDPFVTTKAASKGMGLGLSLTARIVEDHGGRVEVESEAGWGSTFRVLLPLLETPGSTIETVET